MKKKWLEKLSPTTPRHLEVVVDMYVHSSGDIKVLSSMVDAGAIVEMDEEMMPFMNSHSQTLEEAEIPAAHLTVSIWAGKLLGRKFDLYTALVLSEREMFAAFKPFSHQYEHYKKALSIYNYDRKLQAGRHDEMNFGSEMQEIIVLDDKTEDMEMDQASEGEFLCLKARMSLKVTKKASLLVRTTMIWVVMLPRVRAMKKKRILLKRKQGWHELEEFRKCKQRTRGTRSGQSNQAAVDELWEEFTEMARIHGKQEGNAESTNQVTPTVKMTRASSGSSGGGLLPPC
ncbi:hypothetical protein M0R45_001589 [Rubus argutus]|uniref:Uncharacterized protein n=1 Tax=Rubus argutus TaxID=59490 RepID=A0AAW1VHD5_RUBAR